jgi:ABC-2 type transport system permease protein
MASSRGHLSNPAVITATGGPGGAPTDAAIEAGPRAAARLPAGRYGLRQAIRMEWIKTRTLRSTWWMLAITVAAMVGLAIVVLRYYPSHWAHLSRADRASFDPTNDGFTGLAVGQLIMAALGVLLITGEYSSGMIRSTLVAVPRRRLVLAAKAAVAAGIVLVAGEIGAFAAFLAGQSVLSSPAPHATLGQPGVLRAVLMAGAYPALIALIAVGLGAVIRHTAGAISAVVGILFVLPLILVPLGISIQNSVGQFMPMIIAENSLTAVKAVPHSLAPGAGFAVLCGYAVIALAAGGWALAHRDA